MFIKMDATTAWNQISNGCKEKLGLREPVASSSSLCFFIGRKSGTRFHKVEITLAADDTYTLKLHRIDIMADEPVQVLVELDGIYCDGLDQALEMMASKTHGRK